jgi:hypothetical protein
MNRCCCRRNDCEEIERRPIDDCVRPKRRCLEPVLVARIYNQPIVEEVPHSGLTMSMDHMATIREAHTHRRPICGCGCDGEGEIGIF